MRKWRDWQRRVGRAVLALAAGAALFWGGTALACSGNYCENVITIDCASLDEYVDDTCCIETGGGTRQCMTCTREVFLCFVGEGMVNTLGPAFNCRNPGATCQ